jgi:hypothetical protein
MKRGVAALKEMPRFALVEVGGWVALRCEGES